MLHLENFFEKSFALLLTTPNVTKREKKYFKKQSKYGKLIEKQQKFWLHDKK